MAKKSTKKKKQTKPPKTKKLTKTDSFAQKGQYDEPDTDDGRSVFQRSSAQMKPYPLPVGAICSEWIPSKSPFFRKS